MEGGLPLAQHGIAAKDDGWAGATQKEARMAPSPSNTDDLESLEARLREHRLECEQLEEREARQRAKWGRSNEILQLQIETKRAVIASLAAQIAGPRAEGDVGT